MPWLLLLGLGALYLAVRAQEARAAAYAPAPPLQPPSGTGVGIGLGPGGVTIGIPSGPGPYGEGGTTVLTFPTGQPPPANGPLPPQAFGTVTPGQLDPAEAYGAKLRADIVAIVGNIPIVGQIVAGGVRVADYLLPVMARIAGALGLRGTGPKIALSTVRDRTEQIIDDVRFARLSAGLEPDDWIDPTRLPVPMQLFVYTNEFQWGRPYPEEDGPEVERAIQAAWDLAPLMRTPARAWVVGRNDPLSFPAFHNVMQDAIAWAMWTGYGLPGFATSTPTPVIAGPGLYASTAPAGITAAGLAARKQEVSTHVLRIYVEAAEREQAAAPGLAAPTYQAPPRLDPASAPSTPDTGIVRQPAAQPYTGAAPRTGAVPGTGSAPPTVGAVAPPRPPAPAGYVPPTSLPRPAPAPAPAPGPILVPEPAPLIVTRPPVVTLPAPGDVPIALSRPPVIYTPPTVTPAPEPEPIIRLPAAIRARLLPGILP